VLTQKSKAKQKKTRRNFFKSYRVSWQKKKKLNEGMTAVYRYILRMNMKKSQELL